MRKYRRVTASYIMDHIGSFENWKKFIEMEVEYDFGGNYEVDGEDMYFMYATDSDKKFVRAYELEKGEYMDDGRIYDADGMWCAEPSERLIFLERVEE